MNIDTATIARPTVNAAPLQAKEFFSLTPSTPTIGAEIEGLDLGQPLDDETYVALRQALVKHKVLFFRKQRITPQQHVDLARRFGELEVHPVFTPHPDHPELVLLGGTTEAKAAENVFHTDVSWREIPSMASILRCVECPPTGGDTIWVNMVAAYENLPDPMKKRLEGLVAVHDIIPTFGRRMNPEQLKENRAKFPAVSHPVVRTHPESGEKILYVNQAFTTHFGNYLSNHQLRFGSDFKFEEMNLLQFLYTQAATPEYQVRLKWAPDTIAFWDNRSTQHYAIQDYYPAVRRMMRATIIGDRTF